MKDTIAIVLAAVTVATQISYPLLSGPNLRIATLTTVICFAAASLAHCGAHFGWLAAGGVAFCSAGLAFTAESIGVRTGSPFGSYHYATSLGTAFHGVPLVVPAAWTMMAYPALLLGRRLSGRAAMTAALGGATLTGWDVYLDPQMVAAGNWAWDHPTPSLPGSPAIPLTNYAGWLLVGVLIIAALDVVLTRLGSGPNNTAGERVPAALLTWTWLGSAIGNLIFFGRPWVALFGFVAMGATVAPYLRSLTRSTALSPGNRR